MKIGQPWYYEDDNYINDDLYTTNINYEETMIYYFHDFFRIISNKYQKISVKNMMLIKDITINYIKDFNITALRDYYEEKLNAVARHIDWLKLKNLILVQLSLEEKTKEYNNVNEEDILLKICENISYHDYLSLNKALQNKSYTEFTRIYLNVFDLHDFENNLIIQKRRERKIKRILL
jgi:hypothetical protein